MGIFKRGNRYYARWRKDGRLIRKALGPEIKTKAQAEAAFREYEKDRRDRRLGLIDPSRVTLGVLRDQFLTERRGYIAESTIERYQSTFNVLIRDLDEKFLLKHLTARKLSRWAALRLEQGLKPTTVNSDLRHIKAALRRAEKWGMMEKAPDIEFVKTPKRLPRHIGIKDLQTLLKAEADPVRHRLWTFFLWTGLRRREVLNLTWPGVTLGDRPSIRVIGKGDKERIVPLLPPALEALGTPKDIGPVWPQVHPATVSKWFHALTVSCGVKARLHDLRHTCATFLLSRGVNIKAVQEIMGHTDIRITQEYTKKFIGNLYDEMSKVLE